MRKPVLAYIPAAVSNNAVHAAHPLGLALSTTRASKATRVNKDGIIEEVPSGLPRQDWSDGDCPSLLLEPERTNTFTHSEEFNQSVWFKSNCTITTNQIIAPDGTLTADLATSTADGGGVYRFSSWSTIQKTASIFVKKNTSSTAEIFNGSSAANKVVFNLDSGIITTEGGTMTGTIENYGNGWYRLTATHTALGSQTFGLKPSTNQSLYIWGAQLEQGSYPTSYIKTEASTVTREKDLAILWGNSNMFDITEGSFFVDATHSINPLNGYCQITLSDGGNNFIRNIYENGRVRTTVWNGASQFDYFDNGADQEQRNKILLTFKENEFKLYRAGQLITTDTAGAMPTGLSRLDLSNQNGGDRFFEGKVYDVRVYDYVLSESEAIKLTS